MDPKFLNTTHGQIGCTTCHAGNPTSSDPQAAHRGLIGRPSDDPQKACGGCHPDLAAEFTKSLHFTTHGQETGLRALVGSVRWTAARPAYQKSCASCHATCGEKIFVLDVREPEEYAAGHVAGAVNVPIRTVATNLDKLPAKDATIAVICASGIRAAYVTMALRILGYKDARDMSGGMNSWVSQSFPTVK